MTLRAGFPVRTALRCTPPVHFAPDGETGPCLPATSVRRCARQASASPWSSSFCGTFRSMSYPVGAPAWCEDASTESLGLNFSASHPVMPRESLRAAAGRAQSALPAKSPTPTGSGTASRPGSSVGSVKNGFRRDRFAGAAEGHRFAAFPSSVSGARCALHPRAHPIWMRAAMRTGSKLD